MMCRFLYIYLYFTKKMKRKNLVLIFAIFALCLVVPNYIFADSGDNEST